MPLGTLALHPVVPLPLHKESLVGLLAGRLEKLWRGEAVSEHDIKLCSAVYNNNMYLRRKAPDEIEAVLATFDLKSLDQIQERFGNKTMSLQHFAEAIVQSGTYDPKRVLEFVGGVVDLFLEVQRSQKDIAGGAPASTVRYQQLMNHLIESPEIAMFEGQGNFGVDTKARGSSAQNQLHRSSLIDCAKHLGGNIEKTYWLPYHDDDRRFGRPTQPGAPPGDLVTVENTESLYFWPATKSIDAPRSEITPQLPGEFFDETGLALFTVMAIAWDGESQEIVGLLSNRMIVVWRLRSREKGQLQQRRVLRVHANKVHMPASLFGKSEHQWELELRIVDTRADGGGGVGAARSGSLPEKKKHEEDAGAGRKILVSNLPDGISDQTLRAEFARYGHIVDVYVKPNCDVSRQIAYIVFQTPAEAQSARQATDRVLIVPGGNRPIEVSLARRDAEINQKMREKRDERNAAETAAMLDIWWVASMKMYVTTDSKGTLYFWDLRRVETNMGIEGRYPPVHVVSEHTRTVTCVCEISRFKFTTCSLDRSIVLWDNRNLAGGKELRIEEHSSSVLDLVYLPLFSSLVSVGCEKRVFVWSIDSTAYRGVRAKLSAHSRNLRSVTAGQKVFFTLDEGCTVIVWDAATLVNMQTVNCQNLQPKMALAMPTMGRLCIAGRRLNFYEGNDNLATLIGLKVSDEEMARRKAESEAAGSLKERAKPRWCGVSTCRGSMLSVTEQEVRMHSRMSPDKWSVVFNAPEGDSISMFCALESASLAVLGTEKGGIHFLKYRSGFAVKVYQGRKAEEMAQRAQQRGKAAGAREAAVSDADGGAAPGASRGRARSSSSVVQQEQARPWSRSGGARSSASSPTAAEGRQQFARISEANGGASSPQSHPSPAGARATVRSVMDLEAAFEGADQDDRDGRDVDAGRTGYVWASATSRALANAPSADDVRDGLTSNVTCILPCERLSRVFVGTIEGQVLIFALEEDFPCVRWTTKEDASEVTCMQVFLYDSVTSGEEDPGLLVVGTKEGTVQLYGVIHLKPAGLLNIPRILPDNDASQGVPLRYIQIFEARAVGELPCTMLTVDARSRMRLWGLRIHRHNGKLSDLRLVLDGGRPLPLRLDTDSGAALGVAEPGEAEAEVARRKAEAEREIAAKAADRAAREKDAAKKGKHAVAAEAEKDAKESEKKPSVLDLPPAHSMDPRITALCVVIGALELPTFVRFRWMEQAKARELERALALLEAREAASKRDVSPSGRGGQREAAAQPFMTQPPPTVGSAPGRRDDSSDEEWSDQPHVLADRLERRPRTPPQEQEDGAQAPSAQAPGEHFVFFADDSGWIRCIDVKNSVAAAAEDAAPLAVHIDDPVVAFAAEAAREKAEQERAARGKGGASSSAGGEAAAAPAPAPAPAALAAAAPSALATKRQDGGDRWRNSTVRVASGRHGYTVPLLAGPPPASKRTTWRVVGAWRASTEAVVSLVSVSSPPGLVSVDAAKDVKVWSSSGELWASFSLRMEEGVPVTPTMWPPPYTLAAQIALHKVARGLSEKLGLYTSKKLALAQKSMKGRRNSKLYEAKDLAMYRAVKAEQASASGEMAAAVMAANLMLGGGALDAGDGDEDGEGGEDDTASASAAADTPSKPRKGLSRSQMSEMIRGRAFSSGFTSYKRFHSSASKIDGMQGTRRTTRPEPLNDLEAKRKDFFGRRPSAFGVELSTASDEEHWQKGTSGLGTRSSSDGALVRFAERAVSEMTMTVRRELGVDVTTTTRKQMRRPEFVARLDKNHVSYDSSDPNSVTAQAVQKLLGISAEQPEGARALTRGSKSSLQSAGRLATRAH